MSSAWKKKLLPFVTNQKDGITLHTQGKKPFPIQHLNLSPIRDQQLRMPCHVPNEICIISQSWRRAFLFRRTQMSEARIMPKPPPIRRRDFKNGSSCRDSCSRSSCRRRSKPNAPLRGAKWRVRTKAASNGLATREPSSVVGSGKQR